MITGALIIAASIEPQAGQDMTKAVPLIAVIDDDESVREAIENLMKWLGLRSQAFSSAIDFLASGRIEEISCIIADVHMPRMSGIEMRKRMVELGHRVPTILITAFPNEADRARAVADGVICYLSKPFDNNDLIDCIRSVLNLSPG